MEKNPYLEHMGIVITEADSEGAEGYMILRKELTDHLSHTTGGAYNSLADAVGTAAARATGDMYVTQGCSQQFYSSTEVDQEKLHARAKVRHRGSRTCIVAVELYHSDGEVVCDGQFSYSKI